MATRAQTIAHKLYLTTLWPLAVIAVAVPAVTGIVNLHDDRAAKAAEDCFKEKESKGLEIRIHVITPEGKQGTISRDEWPKAEKMGFRLATGKETDRNDPIESSCNTRWEPGGRILALAAWGDGLR